MSWRRRIRDDSGWTHDARTGFKVEGRKLKQDGEKGIWTTDPDPIHPQRFVRNPGPDGKTWSPGSPERAAIPAKVMLRTATWTIADGYTQRPLLRSRAGTIRVGIGASASVSAAIHAAANPVTVTTE